MNYIRHECELNIETINRLQTISEQSEYYTNDTPFHVLNEDTGPARQM